MDYGSSFHGLLRADAGAAWTAYVEHPFVRGLEDGTLPQRSFLHYLQQDYVYLIHYTRAWALAAAKSTDIDEMREFTSTALTLIDGEMQLHIETCAAVGISKAALAATREEPENLAYTRFVLDAGMQGDLSPEEMQRAAEEASRQLQEAAQPAGRMIRPLPFITMRQQ